MFNWLKKNNYSINWNIWTNFTKRKQKWSENQNYHKEHFECIKFCAAKDLLKTHCIDVWVICIKEHTDDNCTAYWQWMTAYSGHRHNETGKKWKRTKMKAFINADQTTL